MERRSTRTARFTRRAAVLLAALSLAAPVWAASPEPTDEQSDAMGMALDISRAFEHAAEVIEPSVVHIITEQTDRRGFRRQSGLGSGVIANDLGYILTNAHVVENGPGVMVRLADGREIPGAVVGAFAESDIAVVKIDPPSGLVPATFGDSESLRVGEWVLAVGSPFGFQQSVTAGIVSAKGRGSIEAMSMSDESQAPQRFQEFIQTDAAINPGNSGGPLVDLRGRVVGINTAILSRSGGNNGLGFAIPIDIAQAVMNRLIETGRVSRGWLGIQMGALPPERAIELGIDGGVVVDRAIDGGPADSAGIRDGDVIVAIGGRTTENLVRLGNAIMLARPGVPVEVEYIRDGRLRRTSATVSDRDEERALALGGVHFEDLGMTIAPEELAVTRGRRVTDRVPGFVVVEVYDNSPADKAGFEAGDFVYEIDGRVFSRADTLERFIDNADLDEGVRFRVIRGRMRGYIDLKADD